jgi:hypothetical protein
MRSSGAPSPAKRGPPSRRRRRNTPARGCPGFEYYDADRNALDGGEELRGVKSIEEIGKAKGDVPLAENESVDPTNVVTLRAGLTKGEVREGVF